MNVWLLACGSNLRSLENLKPRPEWQRSKFLGADLWRLPGLLLPACHRVPTAVASCSTVHAWAPLTLLCLPHRRRSKALEIVSKTKPFSLKLFFLSQTTQKQLTYPWINGLDYFIFLCTLIPIWLKWLKVSSHMWLSGSSPIVDWTAFVA